MADVIVIGGGVAGLAAARELAGRGARVELLEARARLGGRILTDRRRGWPVPVELGAQFIHGGNDPLWRLVKGHRIRTEKTPEVHWRPGAIGWRKVDAARRIAVVTKQIDPEGMRGWSVADFLAWRGPAIDVTDHELVVGFAEGFEAAPLREMSAVALAGETLDDESQYTVPDGYDAVVAALVRETISAGAVVRTRTVCSSVGWANGDVAVGAGRNKWRGKAAIVTLPLGVLQAKPPQRGAVRFTPSLGGHGRAITAMRMGHVFRLNLRLDGRRWKSVLPSPLARAGHRGFGFIHAYPEKIPVWWSFSDLPLITGWVGGPKATALAGFSELQLRRVAIEALSEILRSPVQTVDRCVRDVATHNWIRDPFARGAYTFIRAGYDDTAAELREPLGDALFFAGEATADGEETGTVHGALASGVRAAKQVAAALK